MLKQVLILLSFPYVIILRCALFFVLFSEIDVTSALDRLADPSYNLPALGSVVSKTTTVVTRATARLQIKPEEAPIPPALLDEILVVR